MEKNESNRGNPSIVAVDDVDRYAIQNGYIILYSSFTYTGLVDAYEYGQTNQHYGEYSIIRNLASIKPEYLLCGRVGIPTPASKQALSTIPTDDDEDFDIL